MARRKVLDSPGPRGKADEYPYVLWLLAGVIAAYLVSVVLVLDQGPRPMVDEWIYVSAAEQFAETGRLTFSPIAFAVGIFETVYGGAFLWLFGGSLATLIISTAVLGSFAGIALWDLLTRSGVNPLVAVLSVGMFLYAAVFFGLSSTFMTDAHAVSLIVIAAAFYSRGIDDGRIKVNWLLAGSIVASAGYLSRPGAVGVLVGVTVIGLKARQWSALLWALTVPVVTVGAHLFTRASGWIPAVRTDVAERLSIPGLETLADVTIVIAITCGLWLIPMALPVTASVARRGIEPLRPRFLAAPVLLLVAVALSVGFPLVGNWLNRTGMFPLEESTLGARPLLIGWSSYVVIAAISMAVAVIVLTAVLDSPVRPGPRSAEIGLWAAAASSIGLVLVTQVAAWERILDRYLVVLLPAVLFTVTARVLNPGPVRFFRTSWIMVGVVTVLTVALAIDGMRFQEAVFRSATVAESRGIESTDIDGGAAWTGREFGMEMTPQQVVPVDDRVWWRGRFAPGINPRYVVAIGTRTGECAVYSTAVDTLLGSGSRVELVDTNCLDRE